MPTYDYRCGACGHAFEHFQSMRDKLLRTCPECGRRKLERLIGAGAGIVFKGSGFYETDYKRAGEKRPAEESAPAKPKPTSGSEGKDPAPSTSQGDQTKAGKPTGGAPSGDSGPAKGGKDASP